MTVEDLAQRVAISLREVGIEGASRLVEVSQQLARSRAEVSLGRLGVSRLDVFVGPHKSRARGYECLTNIGADNQRGCHIRIGGDVIPLTPLREAAAIEGVRVRRLKPERCAVLCNRPVQIVEF